MDLLNNDPNEEETAAEEKIVRLGEEIGQLKESVVGVPAKTRPWIVAKAAIAEKDTARELLLEDQRASRIVTEYMEANPSVRAAVEECPICLEPIWDEQGQAMMARTTCCGKLMCDSCFESYHRRHGKVDTCILCRQPQPSSVEEAIRRIVLKAEAGTAWAQCALANMYQIGEFGLRVDLARSDSLYRLAAEQGYAGAHLRLGLLHYQKQEYAEALPFFEAAASMARLEALQKIGIMYFEGQGVEKDEAEGLRLLTVAVTLRKFKSHDSVAAICLGNYFMNLKSPARGRYYFRTGALSGANALAMHQYAVSLVEVGRLYYDGYLDVTGHSPLPEALFWFRRAKDADHTELDESLEGFERQVKTICSYCKKLLSEDMPKRCIACKSVYYCGRPCQVAHWKAGHKVDCTRSLKKSLGIPLGCW